MTRYFPNAIDMHSFTNGLSMSTRSNNWGQIVKFFMRRGTPLPDDLVDGTMNMHHGHAHSLMDHMYEMLTMRKLPEMPVPEEAPGGLAASASGAAEGIPASQVFAFRETKSAMPDKRAPSRGRSRGGADERERAAASSRRGRRRPQTAEGQGVLAGANPIAATAVDSTPVQFGTIKLAHLEDATDLRKTMAQGG